MAQLFGYKPNPEETEWILADPVTPVWTLSPHDANRISKTSKTGEPVILFDALKPLHPNWKRGAQAIGDCVSWGFELACTLATAVDIYVDKEPWQWKGEYATEPIYGGSRVEARGKSQGGWSDGSYGGAAAKWLTKWGALRRLDYSLRTNVASHNLTKYDGQKAKNWGNYGCGGQEDKQALDNVAKEHPVKAAYLVTKYEDAVSAIENGWPIAVCSGQGLGKRNGDGFAPPYGSWSHCMCFTGVRYDKPGLLCSNSWGNSWGTTAPFGPGLDDYWAEVKKCSAWVDAKTVDRMLKQQDSYIITGVKGLEPRTIDWSHGWSISGRS